MVLMRDVGSHGGQESLSCGWKEVRPSWTHGLQWYLSASAPHTADGAHPAGSMLHVMLLGRGKTVSCGDAVGVDARGYP